MGGLDFALRASTFTMQELNKSGTNYSFVPALTPRSGLPLTQMLGDVTLRVKPASADDSVQWAYFASAWAPGSATATAVTPLPKGAVAAHDISALLSATNVDGVKNRSPLKVVRAYSKAADGGPGLEMSFEITNQATQALRLGSFGMPTPSAGGTGNIETNIALDAHIGGEHAWVEWVRVVVDEQTLIATPVRPHLRVASSSSPSSSSSSSSSSSFMSVLAVRVPLLGFAQHASMCTPKGTPQCIVFDAVLCTPKEYTDAYMHSFCQSQSQS